MVEGERRKGERKDLDSSVVLKRIGDKDKEEIVIEVIDLSKSGIGFSSAKALQIGEVYESFLQIWTMERIHAFIQITRIEMKEDNSYEYGAFFVGMPEMDSARIANYGIIEKTSKEMEANG